MPARFLRIGSLKASSLEKQKEVYDVQPSANWNVAIGRGLALMRIIWPMVLLTQIVLGLNTAPELRKLSLNELTAEANSGNAEAQHELGIRYRDGATVPRDSANALKWFRKAADQGHAASELILGWSYREGHLGLEKDPEAAVSWFRRAAEQGDAWGQAELAFMYESGNGVVRDDAEAVKWYTRAAEQGLPLAQFDLAYMYRNGKGVPADKTKALQLYELSAVQIPMARHNLALLYLEGGDKLVKDAVVAYKWGLLDVSAEYQRMLHDRSDNAEKRPSLGEAILLVEQISKRLSKSDKEIGKRLAEEWLVNSGAQLGDERQDFAEAIRPLM